MERDAVDQPEPAPEVPQHPVGQILTHDGRSLALVDLGSSASELLRAAWRESGKQPHESGGVVESAWLLPALGGAGVAAPSLLAGNVFLATANPATLMTIGTGVGSAVMGPGGIVAQAPFVAASTALMPVVAPLMLFSTLSAVVTGARLDRVQRSLGRLSEDLERVHHILDAQHYARFERDVSLLDDLESDLEQRGCFRADDAATLTLIRRSTRELRPQFGQLVERPVTSEPEAQNMVADVQRYFLATILDLRADTLWLYWTLQEESNLVERRQSRLVQKVKCCIGHFRQCYDANPVGALLGRLKKEHAESWRGRWLDRLPGGSHLFGGEEAARLRRVEAIRKDDNAIWKRIWKWITAYERAADEAREHLIVMYREPEGDRALRVVRTRAVRLEKAA